MPVHHAAAGTVARASAAAGVARLVHLSAIGADARSGSAYARSKAAGETAVSQAFPAATILRPSIVFGPEDQFFNRFARLARLTRVVPVIGGGATRFQPVYVGDVAAAAIAALDYDQGGPGVYTYRQLMELLLRQIAGTDQDSPLREHVLVSIPFPVASILGAVMGMLPGAPLTLDQVRLLRRDNVVAQGAATLADLGIEPTAAELILPAYLDRFRTGGWYAVRKMAR
jgi:NADH dehydrogenase